MILIIHISFKKKSSGSSFAKWLPFHFISLNRVKLRYYVLQGIYVLHIFAAKM